MGGAINVSGMKWIGPILLILLGVLLLFPVSWALLAMVIVGLGNGLLGPDGMERFDPIAPFLPIVFLSVGAAMIWFGLRPFRPR